MEISDALRLIDRIQNLPEIYGRIERAVFSVIHSYYGEILHVELEEAKIMESDDFKHNELDKFVEAKKLIHSKYWSNLAVFYQPCSSSSQPDHVWSNLSGIEILQNGDNDNSLFIFKAKYTNSETKLVTDRAYLLKLTDGELKIEHTFFG